MLEAFAVIDSIVGVVALIYYLGDDLLFRAIHDEGEKARRAEQRKQSNQALNYLKAVQTGNRKKKRKWAKA